MQVAHEVEVGVVPRQQKPWPSTAVMTPAARSPRAMHADVGRAAQDRPAQA